MPKRLLADRDCFAEKRLGFLAASGVVEQPRQIVQRACDIRVLATLRVFRLRDGGAEERLGFRVPPRSP